MNKTREVLSDHLPDVEVEQMKHLKKPQILNRTVASLKQSTYNLWPSHSLT